jgi:hypothetical protein
MKADLIRHEFASDAVPNADGRLLLDPGDTLALISRATEEGVPILAVRGVGGAAAHELADCGLADYARAVADGHGCWADADAFVRAHRRRAAAFEVTLGSDPIEAV